MVATRDFSGLISSACPLASAAAVETMLDAFGGLPDIALVPLPFEGIGHKAELDEEVAGQVLRPELAPLFLPEAEQGGFVGNENSAPHLC